MRIPRTHPISRRWSKKGRRGSGGYTNFLRSHSLCGQVLNAARETIVIASSADSKASGSRGFTL